MTNALLLARTGLPEIPKQADPATARDMMRCFKAFSAQRIADQAELEATASAIEYLTAPASPRWIAGRIATTLASYGHGNRDEDVAAAVAEDWVALLEPYPAWALANACRWWISMDNPRRSFKPVPGDIQERAHRELEGVRAARIMLSMGVAGKIEDKPSAARSGDLKAHQDRVADQARKAGEILSRFGNVR